ncbi:MAG: ATP/GTP-binding protein [Methylovulum sp.]|uniref:GTP-binding protein n=1 Tax=Methylovulum sp. TaxID=1916980 RepID=UPI0026038721|nr:ATP/GTP-binding protein [Methylovulum sp.]MDD2724222.1 ATP/GTP-binding protein [Methylovulum sp.]MDD5125085.1 ATP/GTP-binding protein [Methylovulum sp.]
MKPEYLTSPRLATVHDTLKIVFVGTVGSGKTTAISSVSEVPVLGTEAKATEQDALHRKATTTVGIEYGVLHIYDTKVHLYGTPGQRRFDFMAAIACQGAIGMVVMIDNAHQQPLAEIDYFLKRHRDYLTKHPVVVAITHYDDNDTQTYLIEYHNYLKQQGVSCPVMRLDAREKNQVRGVVEKLYGEIMKRRTIAL